MGSPIHEVRRRREAGDHPAGRAVVVTGAADPGPARHPALHLLSPGTSAIWRAAPGPWKMASRRRAASGTSFRIRSRRPWLDLPSKSRSCRRASWPRRSSTSSNTSSRKPRSTGCLKAHDLITSPAFILMKAADRFAQPTTAVNQLSSSTSTTPGATTRAWAILPRPIATSAAGQPFSQGGRR